MIGPEFHRRREMATSPTPLSLRRRCRRTTRTRRYGRRQCYTNGQPVDCTFTSCHDRGIRSHSATTLPPWPQSRKNWKSKLKTSGSKGCVRGPAASQQCRAHHIDDAENALEKLNTPSDSYTAGSGTSFPLGNGQADPGPGSASQREYFPLPLSSHLTLCSLGTSAVVPASIGSIKCRPPSPRTERSEQRGHRTLQWR
jgi:hypothetical protein